MKARRNDQPRREMIGTPIPDVTEGPVRIIDCRFATPEQMAQLDEWREMGASFEQEFLPHDPMDGVE